MSSLPTARRLTLRQQVRLLSGGGFWATRALPECDVPALLMTDGPHGIRVQAAGPSQVELTSDAPATCFPTAATLGNSWDPTLAEEVGRAIGVEARALGVGVVLGPGLNVKRHPLGGRNFEYLSEDPLLTGRLAAALTRGIQEAGVGACVKHYAVNNQESYRFTVDAVVDERTLREVYLAGFEHTVIAAQPRAVMAAYNKVNGSHCTSSQVLLSTVLRQEWNFTGVVISDWGATDNRVAAIRAGMDLEMPGSGGSFDASLIAAAEADDRDRSAVQTSAQRVLDLVAAASAPTTPDSFPVAEHHALARRAAAAGTVLLTNDGLLPLRPGRTVALIGAFAERPRFQGGGSSAVLPTRLDTALDALRARGVDLTYSPGYDPVGSAPDADLIGKATRVARAADVAVVLVGLPAGDEIEGTDREDLGLPRQHDDLVDAVCAANPRTVVALSNGAPILMPWVHRPSAVVECQLGGQAGGSALVDVLFGDAEPGGRLAESFPAAQADVAADPWFPGEPRQVQYREGLFVGYRHHTTSGPPALFAFGHGLSYTSFEWTGVAVDRDRIGAKDDVTVRLTVTNTGSRRGSEVVQLYVHDRTGVVLRPRRELRAFRKVELEPGRSAVVTMVLDARAFAYYDVDRAGWAVPAGTFDLEVARSSIDVRHVLTVEIVSGVTSAAHHPGLAGIATGDEDFSALLRRPIPVPAAVRPFSRESTLADLAAHPVGRLFGRAIIRAIPFGSGSDPEVVRARERAMGETPLRALVLLSGGRLPFDAVDTLVDLVNGRFVGAGRRLALGAAVALGAQMGRWWGRRPPPASSVS